MADRHTTPPLSLWRECLQAMTLTAAVRRYTVRARLKVRSRINWHRARLLCTASRISWRRARLLCNAPRAPPAPPSPPSPPVNPQRINSSSNQRVFIYKCRATYRKLLRDCRRAAPANGHTGNGTDPSPVDARDATIRRFDERPPMGPQSPGRISSCAG
jgi:hypothetical protein